MTLLVVVVVALMVVQQILFERNLRRARANGTGLFRYSPPVRRAIVLVVAVVVIGLGIWTWH